MARSVPRPRKISDFKPLFTNVAQTSHYLVRFGIPWPVQQHLISRGVDKRFIGEDIGLMASDAVIPGSSLMTADISGNYQGVNEKMAHTRQFMQMSLSFYVDRDYKVLKFLEHWIEYIASGSERNALRDGYHFRMRYPKQYKSEKTGIVKFEKDYNHSIEWNFVGLFPLALSDTQVAYEGSRIMKATCTFNYDRYICGKTSSKSWWEGLHINLTGGQRNNAYRTDDAEYRVPKLTVRDDAPSADWRTRGIEETIPNAEQFLKDQGMSDTTLQFLNNFGPDEK